MFDRILAALVIAMLACGLGACSGGGGGGEDDEDDDAGGAGIWNGTYRVDGDSTSRPMVGLVTEEEGEFAFFAAGDDPSLPNARPPRTFHGTGASSDGSSFSATADSYLGGSTTTRQSASMSGTIVDRSSITGSYSVPGESGTFTLNFSATYDRPSSLTTLAGTYSATGNEVTITMDVTTSGAFTYTNSASGCTITGSFTVPQPSQNYYRFTGTPSGCPAGSSSISGWAFLGDTAAGQNRLLSALGQNQARTAPFVVFLPK